MRKVRPHQNVLQIGCVLFAIFLTLYSRAEVGMTNLKADERSFTKYVDLMIGTKGNQMIPGPALPFGMLQFSPDTSPDPASDYREAYRYEHSYIRAFSLTHFSGAGAHTPMDVPIMPTVGSLDVSPVGKLSAYASRFSHERERAVPGSYSVRLDSTELNVELSSTKRTGFAQFTYPSTNAAHLLINTSGRTYNRPGTDAHITIDAEKKIVTGWAKTEPINANANKYIIYYAYQFDKPFSGFGTWKGAAKAVNSTVSSGKDCAGYVSFDTTSDPVVKMKVGVSFVSVENALDNLRVENPGWDIEALKRAADLQWNNVLKKCEVTRGGTADEIRLFYTALYRSVLHPNVFSDCNGEYVGFDNKVHKVAQGHDMYANFSLWDVYRTQAALLGLLFPAEASDMVTSLVLDAEQSTNGGLPIWSHNNDDADIMNGYSADPFIASIYAFGGRDFDLQRVKDRMVSTAMNSVKCNNTGAWRGLAAYKELGYCLHGTEDAWTDVSSTLEYCVDDFSIAQVCKAAGDQDNYLYFLERSQNWRNLFNADNGEGGYMQSRKADGTWVTPFSKTDTEGFAEGNSAHYTWMVNHNVGGLAQMMGGNEAMDARLDAFFSKILTDGWNINEPYFWAGNETDVQAPFLYNWIGKPWKTQKAVRDCMEAAFQATPTGLHGDDDLGAMYSWYVWCALGLYPEICGAEGATLCSPLFQSVTVHLPNGKQLVINAKDASSKNTYIQSCKIDGHSSSALWIPLSALTKGAKLDFTMGGTPNKQWAAGVQDAPPSFDAASKNLALGKTATDGANKKAASAVDGSTKTKWRFKSALDNSLTVDLGREYRITRYVVKHAAVKGETGITKDFKVQISSDGLTWRDADNVIGNKAKVTDRNIVPQAGRYVRLCLAGFAQTANDRAAIADFEVYGRVFSNLALHKNARANGWEKDESPAKGVDGETWNNSKWCFASSQDHKWLALDLKEEYKICRWVVKHAAAGGEDPKMNTKDFKLQKSADGQSWVDVDVVTGNTENVTDRVVPVFTAKHVRLYIETPTQTEDSAARIYEFEVHDSPFATKSGSNPIANRN